MELPPEIVANQIFVPGGAYRKLHEYGTETKGPKYRYFFILNKNPETDEDLIIVTATTQIASRRKTRYYKVLVEVGPNEYDSFTENSLLDCNSARKVSKGEVFNWIKNQEIVPAPALSEHTLNRVCGAIRHASVLSPKEQRLVLGKEETTKPCDLNT